MGKDFAPLQPAVGTLSASRPSPPFNTLHRVCPIHAEARSHDGVRLTQLAAGLAQAHPGAAALLREGSSPSATITTGQRAHTRSRPTWGGSESLAGFREGRRGDETMRSIDDDAPRMQDGALAADLERTWVVVQVRETCSHWPVFQLAPVSPDEV